MNFYKESKSKKKEKKILFSFFFFVCVCVEGGGGGGGGEGFRWMNRSDEQAQTNLLFQLLRSWGHNNA